MSTGAILMKMGSINPSHKSVVVEFSVKPSLGLGIESMVWQKPLTQDTNLAEAVRVNSI